MSKISLKPNASGTGVFSLEAPNSNSDRTLSLPDEAGTLATVENLPAGYTDSDALDLFNATGTAPVYACRAWVNFNGTGTVSIRKSGNVSSITDRGTGEYTVNFATNMEDADYCVTCSHELNDGVTDSAALSVAANGSTTSGVSIVAEDADGGFKDYPSVYLAIFR